MLVRQRAVRTPPASGTPGTPAPPPAGPAARRRPRSRCPARRARSPAARAPPAAAARTRSSVTGSPASVRTPWRIHCQSCARAISAVAVSSIMLLMATAPDPRSQASRYWSATDDVAPHPRLGDPAARHPHVEQLLRRSTRTSSRWRSFWWGRSAQHRVEHLLHHRHQVGVRHPGAVVAGARPRGPCPPAPGPARRRSPRRRAGWG